MSPVMSPVYYVAAGEETEGEPRAGWYFVGNDEPHGPYMSRDNALGFYGEWRAKGSAAGAASEAHKASDGAEAMRPDEQKQSAAKPEPVSAPTHVQLPPLPAGDHRWKVLPEVPLYTAQEMLDYARRAIETCAALAPSVPAEPTALERFNVLWEFESGHDPIERLRFFCSLAMNGQDWLDVEPFFDAIAARGPAEEPRLREALAELVACKDLHDRCENMPSDPDDPAEPEAQAMWQEYRRRKPLAWAAARAALALPVSGKPSVPAGVLDLLERARPYIRGRYYAPSEHASQLLDAIDAALAAIPPGEPLTKETE